jgi:phosphoglycolate phosphatase-like HAD superfamily hydrolase
MSRALYARAFQEVLGRPLTALPDMGGRTERWILAEALALHDATLDDHDAFFAAMATAATALADGLATGGRCLPGAREAVEALAGVDGLVQTVVTGNIRPVAAVKLGAFGLDALLDLDVGGYGTDATDRPPLVRLAVARAEARHGVTFAPARTIVVGDTPHDVAAAQAIGARTIAVATGRPSAEALVAAGADHVLPGLADTGAITSIVAALLA